jgi:formylglycine-generating enzyme required for sulfatase activity
VPVVTDVNSDLAPAFDSIVERALAKAPADRYRTARELAEAVAKCLAEPEPREPRAAIPAEKNENKIEVVDADEVRELVVRLEDHSRALGRGLQRTVQTSRTRVGEGLDALNIPRSGRRQALAMVGGLLVVTLALTGLIAVVNRASLPAAPTRPPATPTPAPPSATPLPTQMALAAPDQMLMVHVPAGNFLLGSADGDPNAHEDEKPQTTVFLDAFWIDRTEVTVAQFQDFVDATGYVTEAEQGSGEGDYARPGGIVFAPDSVYVASASWRQPEGVGAPSALPRRPVVQVSWNDARAYCAWAGRRLPTEAEWDKAARGVDGRLYPWGDVFEGQRLNFCDANCPARWRTADFDDGYSRTSNVGSFLQGASPFGALDLSGNVWEWVNDHYDFRGYYRFPTANPPGAATGSDRALRGGAWLDTFDRVRAAARASGAPYTRNNITGFRCAAEAVSQ